MLYPLTSECTIAMLKDPPPPKKVLNALLNIYHTRIYLSEGK
jgi:predicted transcriptional regulator with HTH domain